MKINNRRYIGCKTKLIDFIYGNIIKFGIKSNSIFLDLFAGTGVVAYKFASEGYKTILNDNLYSNFVIYQAFLGKGEINKKHYLSQIAMFNKINPDQIPNNYFSNIYGNKYYSISDAKKIGFIREQIEKNRKKYTKREYYSLIASLLYASDKIANTVGHFESFLNKKPKTNGVKLEPIEFENIKKSADIYNCDANQLIKKIKADVVYLDPPYNARQYVNFYHVLENLACWKKPKQLEGNSAKFKRDELKSGYCRTNTAFRLFQDLIKSIKAKLIVVSYSNTYKAKSSSSINTITRSQIISCLKNKGKVWIKERSYKAFNSGKTNITGHKEYLYICEVKK